jgi:hypothetical protein
LNIVLSVSSFTPLSADVVWPALLLEQRLLSVIPITVGLIVEWLALWFGGFGFSWKKAAVVDVAMNAVSAAVGAVLIPALGLLWELLPGQVIHKVFHVGTFNPWTWAATIAIAVLVTTAIEAAVVRWGFKVVLIGRRLWVLGAANCVSIGIAFLSFWVQSRGGR